jgi:uncharacterized YccA/Bax inhibitor family protein
MYDGDMRTSNPALKDTTFGGLPRELGAEAMTLQGTVNKTGICLLILVACAAFTWNQAMDSQPVGIYALGGAILGFVVALVTIFKKTWAPVTAPLYAALEGLFLGAISAIYESRYPGLPMNAVGLTFGCLAALLAAYSSGLIRPSENFKLGIVAATGAVGILYLVSIGLGFFGVTIPGIFGSGPIGIAFSLFVVGLAALNLVLDFDLIETGVRAGAPKYMEWYGAFGLLVTLIWLYLEILRLLAKLQDRRR